MAGGPGMPYVLARNNNTFSSIENVSLNVTQQLESLKRLIPSGTVPPADLWDSPRISASERDHVRKDWFGGLQTPTSPASNSVTTGWWSRWSGNAQGIVRETFIRAYQVSLAIPDPVGGVWDFTGDGKAATLAIVWACGSPQFQGFVSWDSTGGRVSAVTITLATPQVAPEYIDVDTGAVRTVSPMLVSGVEQAQQGFQPGPKGMLVIGHQWCTCMTRHARYAPGNSFGRPVSYITRVDPDLQPNQAPPITNRLVPGGTPVLPQYVRVGHGDIVIGSA
jgi:hypothetical protein